MDRSPKEESSELSKYCAILKTFGKEGREGIVAMCSIASSNFGADPGSAARTSLPQRDRGQQSPFIASTVDLPSRGQEHYQWGSVLSPKESETGRKACYACLLRQIAWVGFTPQGRGTTTLGDEEGDEGLGSETGVSACVSEAVDVFIMDESCA